MAKFEFERFFEDALYDEFIRSESEGKMNRLISVFTKIMLLSVTSEWPIGWRTISALSIKIKEENQKAVKF